MLRRGGDGGGVFGTVKRAWQRGSLYGLWESPGNMECELKRTRAPWLAEVSVQSQSSWKERWPSPLGASCRAAVLNANSAASVLSTSPPELQGRARHILTLRPKPGSFFSFFCRNDFLAYIYKERFILPEINHSFGDWPLCGAAILKGSWPVKADLSQMSTRPQKWCPGVNSPWWEKLAS